MAVATSAYLRSRTAAQPQADKPQGRTKPLPNIRIGTSYVSGTIRMKRATCVVRLLSLPPLRVCLPVVSPPSKFNTVTQGVAVEKDALSIRPRSVTK